MGRASSPPKPDQYPKLVQVRDATYHVVFYTRLKDDDCGYCDFDGKVIGLSRNQSDQELFATYWHEVLHAFEFEYGVRLGHPKIRKLEWAIASFLVSNRFGDA